MPELSLRQRIALELNRQIVNDLEVRHPLQQLFWESTLRCNMSCRHCGSDCRVSALQPDMPFEDFEKVLLRIKEKYDSHKIMVIISGGEPLVREDFFRNARRIHDLEFAWGMVSNGRLLTPDNIRRCLAAGMQSCTVSLDGFEDDHNWLRGKPDAFRYASEAVRILAAEKSILFDVVTCVNNRNYERLAEFKEYLIGLGLKDWRLFTVFPVGRAATDPDLQLSADRLKGLMEFIDATRREGRIHASYGCEGFLGRYEGKARDHLFSCQAGLTVGSVMIDGSISACGSIRSNYSQGNIYKDDFIDVWENRFAPFRDRSWMKKDECASCKWFRYCRGGGMHLRDDEGKLILCHMDRLK